MVENIENIDELIRLIELSDNSEQETLLFKKADSVRRKQYNNHIYIRGLIEITSFCKNNCYYCGIRAGNKKAARYRLTKGEIISACENGYDLGFRTFVLQGGEDSFFSDKVVCDIVETIKTLYPDCAITLSLGEKDKDSFKAFFDAGATRYLLRHETADGEHYNKLHPNSMVIEKRKECLYSLKEIGFQVGTGIMVGSPFQTTANIIEDLKFMKSLKPDMIGIGPYLTHRDTPFSHHENGSLNLSLRLIAILRLMFPYALIPATTSLATISEGGRELGLLAGANVIMPNLSPKNVRGKYNLYDNKAYTGIEGGEGISLLKKRVRDIGYEIVVDIGDVKAL